MIVTHIIASLVFTWLVFSFIKQDFEFVISNGGMFGKWFWSNLCMVSTTGLTAGLAMMFWYETIKLIL